jgi:hypothetical protein
LSDSTASADTESANWDSSEAMSEAASENGGVRIEEAAATRRSKGPELNGRLLQLFLQILILSLPGAILRQQLLEDASSECVQVLGKTERQRFLAKSIFESAVSIATSKLGG